ncbi:globin [Caballeronia arationis]|jgi:nitric oxide dioxygenase|uniref:Flavohemoprotein n=2 Tax=Caballeronia arationis TaxID=1777142 RepID=A0A7Z7I2K4_9BURK|nr:globin [Caballeronia arationis]SOE51367.1 Hemoglobin-like flavoprotein [Caballeronia arationis]
MALTPRQTEIIKSSAPVLSEHGLTVVTRFYRRLFEHHPELRNLFNHTNQRSGGQQEALAHAVWAYASNIDNLGALGPAVKRISQKHASLGVQPEHYPIVGEHLLAAMGETLGDAFSDEMRDAWAAAYQQLADVMIDAEKGLYSQRAAQPGGWIGWRPFEVVRKVDESDEITSFYLVPTDGKLLPPFDPGQFVSVKRYVGDLGLEQPRQYSLSDAPHGKWLRISVKREGAGASDTPKPAGRVSNLLHDELHVGGHVEVSAPYGDFVLDRTKRTPVVLVSGGVGLTPMVSMLATIVMDSATRYVSFLHACRKRRVHAFREWLDDIVADHPNASKITFYEEIGPNDVLGRDYDFPGLLDLAKIREAVLFRDADYYLCGPMPFMRAQVDALKALGVDASRIHTEVFGVGDLR